MDSLAFLDRSRKGKPEPIYVLTGDEDFLRRQVLAVLKDFVLGDADESFGLSVHAGDKAEYSSVRDDLATAPFLGPRRLVRVEDADPFVTRYRTHLEKYFGKPAETGVLVLEAKTWPNTTRLAKMLSDAVTIVCKAPAMARLPQWCIGWASAHYSKQLTQPAAQLLVELIGAELGLLDQELNKLSIYVGSAARIDVGDVDLLVGRSQGANIFKIFDAIGTGRPAEALNILGQLFDQGEEPIRMLGAFSMQLRRLAQAARLSQQGVPLAAAFDRVGVPAWPAARQSTEAQLRHLGRRRAERLFDWLIELDLGLKGSSQLPPRTLFERLVARLARPRES